MYNEIWLLCVDPWWVYARLTAHTFIKGSNGSPSALNPTQEPGFARSDMLQSEPPLLFGIRGSESGSSEGTSTFAVCREAECPTLSSWAWGYKWLHFQNVWKSICRPSEVNSLGKSSDPLTAGIQYMEWNSCSKIVPCAGMPHCLHISAMEEQCMRENNLIQPKTSCLYLLIKPRSVGDVGLGGWVVVPPQNKTGLMHHGTHILKHLLHRPVLFDANSLVVDGNLRDAPV